MPNPRLYGVKQASDVHDQPLSALGRSRPAKRPPAAELDSTKLCSGCHLDLPLARFSKRQLSPAVGGMCKAGDHAERDFRDLSARERLADGSWSVLETTPQREDEYTAELLRVAKRARAKPSAEAVPASHRWTRGAQATGCCASSDGRRVAVLALVVLASPSPLLRFKGLSGTPPVSDLRRRLSWMRFMQLRHRAHRHGQSIQPS